MALPRRDFWLLPLVSLAALQPDYVMLPWSHRLVREAGPPLEVLRHQATVRPILTEVDGESALAWGQAHGLDLFAGPFLDHVQTALRMQRCHSAAACTLAQCGARAASLTSPGRAGCANPALLAAGAAVAA